MKIKYLLILVAFVLICNTSIAQTNPMLQPVKSIGKNIDTTLIHTVVEDTTLASSQSAPSGPGDRFIYWVHGLGGSESSWVMAASATQTGVIKNGVTIFPPRKAENITQIKYDESVSSFPVAEFSLHEIIHGKRQGISQATRLGDFIIAHSQGGLVSRYLDKDLNTTNTGNYYRDFGGLVTFGTPHGGAAIINSAQNNVNPPIAKFFEDACNAMTIGPIDEGLGNKWYVKLFKLNKLADEFRQTMCENVGVFGNTFARLYTGNLGVEYKTNASAILSLKTYTTPTPSVCFYGIKPKEGLAFDILYSYTIQEANNYPHFEAQKSTLDAKTEANNTMNDYKTKADQVHMFRDWKIVYFPLPGIVYFWNYKALYYNQYMQGVNFIKNADERWQDIIGARIVSYTTVYETECVNPNDLIANDATSNSPYLRNKYKIADDNTNSETPENPCVFPEVPVYITRLVKNVTYKESDGIVLAESASAFTGAAFKRRLYDSNHEQMKNDENTRKALTDVYNGQRGIYFLTPPR